MCAVTWKTMEAVLNVRMEHFLGTFDEVSVRDSVGSFVESFTAFLCVLCNGGSTLAVRYPASAQLPS